MTRTSKTWVIWLLLLSTCGADESDPAVIQVNNAIVKLIREVEVPAQTAGLLGAVHVREGQPVRQGELLAEIVDTKVQFDVKRKKLELATAQANYRSSFAVDDAELAAAVANTEYDRVMEANSNREGTYQPAEVDRYKLQKDRADLAVEKAKFEQKLLRLEEMLAQNEVDAASRLLELFAIKAPWDGTIVSVNSVSGAWVEAGTSVAKIIDSSQLRVEGFVASEHSVADLMEAQVTVRFRPAMGEPIELAGEVVFVSPDVNPVSYQARVFIDVDNREGKLRPGWKVEVELQLPKPLPTTAVEMP